MLTLVGKGDSWESCPFEGEVWGVVTCVLTEGLTDKHYDKLFAFDPDNDNADPFYRQCLKEARRRGIPIVSTFSWADERYPTLQIIEEFKVAYIRTSFTYMLALAIYLNKNPLAIYGFDQTEGEYFRGKPFVTFWLGVAVGRGIKYNIISASIMPQLLSEETIDRTRDPSRGMKYSPLFKKQEGILQQRNVGIKKEGLYGV